MPPICGLCGNPVDDNNRVECPVCHEVDHRTCAIEAAEASLRINNVRINLNGPIAMCSHGHIFNPDAGRNVNIGRIAIEPPPFPYYVILTPLSLAALSLLYLRVMPYLIAARAFVFLSSLLTFLLAAGLIDTDSNIPWVAPLLGELMLMPIISNAELNALAWSSIVLTSILLPALIARKFEDADVGYIEHLALITIAIANALPGIALGQLYYVTLMHFGPGSLVTRALSAILLVAVVIVLIRIWLSRVLRINDDNMKKLMTLIIIFMLIIIALTPAYILEIMTWLTIAAITIMIMGIALGFLRNDEDVIL